MASTIIRLLFLCTLVSFVQAMETQESCLKGYDLSKLRFYDSSETLEGPYLKKLERNKFQLHYIASKHAFVKNAPVFTMINEEIDSFQPTIVILEGFQNHQIVSIVSSPESENEMEPIFALRRACAKKIQVCSGELPPADLMAKMHFQFREEHEKCEDVYVFYILRMFHQELKRKNLNHFQTTQEAFESILIMEENFIGERFSYERLMNWLKGHKFDNLNSLLSDLIQNPQLEAYWVLLFENVFKPIQLYDVYFRDQYILKLILDARYKEMQPRILVVYGGDHYETQKEVLAEHYDMID